MTQPVNCNSAGVMGPSVAMAGALMADAVLSILCGAPRHQLISYDGLNDTMRALSIPRRPGCILCGDQPTITDIDPRRYAPAACAA